MSHLDAIRAFLAPFDPVVLYAADPGAHAVMAAIDEGLAAERPLRWAQDGWSAASAPRPGAVPPLEVFARVPALPGRPALVVLGPQMSFATTRAVLHAARSHGWRSAFIYDHWSPYFWRHHFAGDDGALDVLPDFLLTMDEVSRDTLLEVLAPLAPEAALRERIRIVGQPSVDAKVAHIRGLPPAALDEVRRRAAAGRRYDLLLLEPMAADMGTDAAGRPLIGYDEHGFLADAHRFLGPPVPGRTVVVKPHPRHDGDAIRAQLARYWAGREVVMVDRMPVEDLIAAAERVFGMTTVALITAIKAGRPTQSWQLGRNPEGMKFTNPWLERCLVAGPKTTGAGP